MRVRRITVAVGAFVVGGAALLVGCSGDDTGPDTGSDTGSDAESPTTTTNTTTNTTTAVADAAATAPSTPPDADPVATLVAPSTETEPPPSTERPLTTFEVVEVPETGVPGLDSDDSFCAAWSRFGGTWQVIQVASNFAPDPTVVPAMEVVAAPVVVGAYDAMLAAWPDDLDDERDVVADGFFGPLDRRAQAALDALISAGANDADVAALGSAWVDALAARQPDDPVLFPELTDELGALVDVAAAEFASQRVDFIDDPSMRITAETPLTDAYLATACPDQGALTGGEIDGG